MKLNKYSANFKLNIVKSYLKGEMSTVQLAKKYGLTTGDISLWLLRYKYHGEKVFSDYARPNISAYDSKFKLKVLKTIESKQLSNRQATALFNLSNVGVVKRWQEQFKCGGIEALEPKRSRPDMKKPKKNTKQTNKPKGRKLTGLEKLLAKQSRRIEYLEAENEYLKKLDALMKENQAHESEQ